MKSCCPQSPSGAWHSVSDDVGDRDNLEQGQMKGLPALSYEELLTDARRGDKEDVILRRPISRRDEKIGLCVFKGDKIQKRKFRPRPRILPLMALPESSSERPIPGGG